MRIEGVIISVGYGDFLAWTLPLNKHTFDRVVVVTTPDDRHTRDVCEHNNVECVTTDAFFHDGSAFNKGAGICEGLKALSCFDWVIHIDADIVLPPRTREILERVRLDPSCIYGVDRMMCRSFDDWARHLTHPEVQHSLNIFVQANAFPLGVRIAKLLDDGYIPIGFFQMWNPGKTGRCQYLMHGEADRSDMRFAQQWDRRHRLLIPEIVAIHLESEMSDMGTNWQGRKTIPFGPHPLTPPCPRPPDAPPQGSPLASAYIECDEDDSDEDCGWLSLVKHIFGISGWKRRRTRTSL